ncbi:hypothetical protein CHS0354_040227 [Potamilus streckersoni]|uniref:Uncharacterized protein n=1 Tax=Potamilus streckersoni TaxID=2493646 RepID=A0AAE0VP04_9BIVA|nr:hypothetical protein CHS0354_040227 [Potamilus streckersoni]
MRETGLLLTSVPPEVLESGFYKGSKDKNEQKIIRNVFVDGDDFFTFGDLIHLDKEYFVYFKDRIGKKFSNIPPPLHPE